MSGRHAFVEGRRAWIAATSSWGMPTCTTPSFSARLRASVALPTPGLPVMRNPTPCPAATRTSVACTGVSRSVAAGAQLEGGAELDCSLHLHCPIPSPHL